MKDLAKLLSQKPDFLTMNDNVRGSSDLTGKDVYIDAQGNITHDIDGDSNRPVAQLWGSIKLFTDIFDLEYLILTKKEGNLL